MRSGTRAIGWFTGLLGAAGLLRLAATGDLSAPPLHSFGALTSWIDERAPITAAMALVRLLAEASVWYVLGLSALHVATRGLRVGGGHRLADALAVPGVRRLVHAGLGLGLATASSVTGDAEVSAPDSVTMAPVVDAPVVTQRRVDDPGGTAAMRPQRPADHASGVAEMVPAPAVWTVAPGESFWSIAEELLTDGWGRAPTVAELDPYWRALVERNRDRLVDPADPDLIHPGQVFEVPAIPSPAS